MDFSNMGSSSTSSSCERSNFSSNRNGSNSSSVSIFGFFDEGREVFIFYFILVGVKKVKQKELNSFMCFDQARKLNFRSSSMSSSCCRGRISNFSWTPIVVLVVVLVFCVVFDYAREVLGFYFTFY
jgi:hypothetical protein